VSKADQPTNLDAAAAEARRSSAVSFLDIVGYSTLMAENAARTHLDWMKVLNEIVRPAATQYGGRIVKSTGDGVLAEFPDAPAAVAWATAVQNSMLAEYAAAGASRTTIVLRIAVHVDRVFVGGDDIYGPGVNIAARLQEYSEPGGIVLSDAVFDLVKDALDRPVRELGLLRLKNIPSPVKAYSLDPMGPVPPVPQFRHEGLLPSIAVLPLQNRDGDPGEDYFAEGIVEDITVSLASLHELLVIARASSLAMSRQQTDPHAIGRSLGVRYVLAGNVRRTPNRVRVAVQLHDVDLGISLWGDTAEGAPDELFEIQDRIVARVVAGIAPRVQSAELYRALRKRPQSFTAYDYTLHALDRLRTLEKKTFIEAREYLEQAIAEDRSFAMPVAWLARWHSLLIGQGWSDNPRQDRETACDVAAKAIELDGQNALALATYGHLRAYLFHDYDTALVYFDRALAACPNSAVAWILSSGTLSYVGRGEDAVLHAERAMRLSPFDHNLFSHYTFLGLAHYTRGAYDEAVKWGRMALSERPMYTANLRVLAASLAAYGQLDEAHEVAVRLMSREPGFTLGEFERTLLPFRDRARRAQYLDHLRQAGLPP
jgi:adenylate cyclase